MGKLVVIAAKNCKVAIVPVDLVVVVVNDLTKNGDDVEALAKELALLGRGSQVVEVSEDANVDVVDLEVFTLD